MFALRSRSTGAAPFAALLLAIVTLAGCSSDPAGSGNTAGTAGGATNTATKSATNAPGTTPGGMPGNMPVPMGMEDSIEGRVVAVLCLEKDPNMPAAEAKACAESTSKGGGALAVLGSDGVLYIKVPEELLMARLTGRWNCPNCSAIYHELSSPPKQLNEALLLVRARMLALDLEAAAGL